MKKTILGISIVTLLLTGCAEKENEIVDNTNIENEIIQNDEIVYDEFMSGDFSEEIEEERVVVPEETLIISKEKIINVLKQNAAIIENEDRRYNVIQPLGEYELGAVKKNDEEYHIVKMVTTEDEVKFKIKNNFNDYEQMLELKVLETMGNLESLLISSDVIDISFSIQDDLILINEKIEAWVNFNFFAIYNEKYEEKIEVYFEDIEISNNKIKYSFYEALTAEEIIQNNISSDYNGCRRHYEIALDGEEMKAEFVKSDYKDLTWLAQLP